jgi:hypothetical protein
VAYSDTVVPPELAAGIAAEIARPDQPAAPIITLFG